MFDFNIKSNQSFKKDGKNGMILKKGILVMIKRK